MNTQRRKRCCLAIALCVTTAAEITVAAEFALMRGSERGTLAERGRRECGESTRSAKRGQAEGIRTQRSARVRRAARASPPMQAPPPDDEILVRLPSRV